MAEAALQDDRWSAELHQLSGLARLRIIYCTTDRTVAFSRCLWRAADETRSRRHIDPGPGDEAEHAAMHFSFKRLSIDAPSKEVDTSSGYQPAIEEVIAFAASAYHHRPRQRSGTGLIAPPAQCCAEAIIDAGQTRILAPAGQAGGLPMSDKAASGRAQLSGQLQPSGQ